MNQIAENLPEVKVIADMSNDEYHSQPSFSSSQIKDFIDAKHPPKYFYEKHITKSFKPVEKIHFNIGQAVHTCWMEPEKFNAEFVVEDLNLRTILGRERKAEILESGKVFVNLEQAAEIAIMTKRLNANKQAMALKQGCLIENSIFWTDKETGLDLRVRPDMWRRGAYVPDLKSTRDASFATFQKDIFNYGYHISAAMYLEGVKQLGEELSDFIYICVENTEPYLTAIYTLSDEALEIGHREYRKALIGIAERLDADNWPGHNNDEVTEISLPQWVINREIA